MCGIVGYTGYQNARNIILEGLATLEYRGYDSAGIALGGKKITLTKCGGRVAELEKAAPFSDARVGIGHTRWATHGKPSARNAHPHLSADGKIAVVHNGIIENCDELRALVSARGIAFNSDTDSEIIAHLLSFEDVSDMLGAMTRVAEKLKGAASFLAIRENDDKIYCYRRGASLAIGLGANQNFVASDTLAITKHTREVIILEDDEAAVISQSGAAVYKNGKRIYKQPVSIDRTAPSDCNCYMRAEINEIPYALRHTYESFLSTVGNETISAIAESKKVCFAGCGTAYHACLYGKEVFECVAKKPSETYIASEFGRARFVDKETFAIFISQSGETADTLSALCAAKARGAKTLAITNVKGSSVTFAADYTLLLDAGAEIAVAATKSYNCQLLALYLIANKLAGKLISSDEIKVLADKAEDVALANLFDDGYKTANLFFVGKGVDEITAREGALKFKEITYKMTDAYPLGELKHGTIALIDGNSTVVVVASEQSDINKIRVGVNELRSRGARTVAISAVGDVGADKTLTVPKCEDEFLYPVLCVIPLQSLALTTSLSMGLSPDKPRNLAKSVTVV